MYTRAMIQGIECVDQTEWDDAVHDLGGHPFQLWGWGQWKSHHEGEVRRIIFRNDEQQVSGAAQLLVRSVRWPFRRVLYVLRGPMCKEGSDEQVLKALSDYARVYLPGAVLTVEPDTEVITFPVGWRAARAGMLPSKALIVDLALEESALLERMARETREYVYGGEREALVIRRVKGEEQIAECLSLYRQTGDPDDGTPVDNRFYYDMHEKLGESSVIFAAYKDEMLVAFVWLAISSRTACQLYAGASDEGRAMRASYALEWHVITTCKEWGIRHYDMTGLGAERERTFEQGFSSRTTKLVGAHDYPLSSLYVIWMIWSWVVPFAKKALERVMSLRK